MNKIALLEVFNHGGSCHECGADFDQNMGRHITEWRNISDEELKALELHIHHMFRERSRFVIVRQVQDAQVGLTIDEALARVKEIEAQAEVRRQAAAERAARAAQTKAKREQQNKVKQFEKLQETLRKEGLLKEDGSVRKQRHGK